ncbi:MAG: hypothetical protein HFI64_07015 [Lachnospiraceae bacterium]|nr:hypothetical protein [Lachnospiraceae bacterium]
MAKKRVTYALLVLAVILLAGSAIGSTRAAITYYSDNYTAEITVSQIGVSLLENGEVVSSRNYDDNEWKMNSNNGSTVGGALLQNMLDAENGEKLALNRKYDEKLTVRNSGSIDEYVRVRVYRYWMKDGKKVTSLSPDLIDLNLVNQGVWVEGPAASAECVELFHKGILSSGEESAAFADTIRIDGKVASEARTEVDESAGTVTTVYKYDGVEFHVDVEVDAVQTHNARDAIKSAWGVDAESLGIL